MPSYDFRDDDFSHNIRVPRQMLVVILVYGRFKHLVYNRDTALGEKQLFSTESHTFRKQRTRSTLVALVSPQFIFFKS